MNTNDFLIDAAKNHLLASKNLEYRARVKRRFRAFICFLQDNGLTTRELLSEDQPVTEELKVMKSDLTDDGFAVVKAAYDKWLRGIDRGKDIEDVTLLEKSLKTVRTSKA